MAANKISRFLLPAFLMILASCTSQKKLAYLNNLPAGNGEENFNLAIPEYKLQPRDILYITIKAMTPDGTIKDFLSSGLTSNMTITQGDAGALYGYTVDSEGNINVETMGQIKVAGLTLEETKKIIQEKALKVFKNSVAECRLLSFKYTVIGEVKAPGTYVNYNNFLTVLEAIGHAGGIGDYGNRDRVLVVRPFDKGTRTYRLNLQNKSLLTSEAYFLLPNDVVIIEPMKQKIFNMNLPTISFLTSTVASTVTITLLLINFFK